MKIVIFGDERRIGVLEGDQVVDVELAFIEARRAAGDQRPEREARDRLGADLADFIGAGNSALDAAAEAVNFAKQYEGSVKLATPLDSTRLRAPWPQRRIACAGGNFADHLQPMRGGTIEEITKDVRKSVPFGFWKVPVEVAGPDDEIPYPKRTEYFDYEGEVAIVLGKTGKDIPEGRLLEYVWGVTLFNDVSIRDERVDTVALNYNLAKNFDGCSALGPVIVVNEGLDPSSIDVELAVNGELRQKYSTSAMIFSFGEVLSFLSRDFTFVPGDVISGGTAKGTAMDSTPAPPEGAKRSRERYLKPGDTIELSSPSIGTLTNRVV